MGVDLVYEGEDPQTVPSWVLAVDYGTTYTTAAIREGNRVDLVQISDSPWIPSTILLDTEGQLLAGASAEAQAAIYPDRFERTPKRYVGDVPLMLGGYVVPVQDAVGATLYLVAREAIRLQGGPPAELRLTHPARWQTPRLAVLHSAAVRAGLPAPVLIPEPVTAAVHFASRTVRLGERLAVYDFGGGTFDTAVLQRTSRGFTVLPEPGGDDQLGGEDIDYALYKRLLAIVEREDPATADALRSSDDRAWVATRMQFLAAVRAAKERLSDEQVTRLFVQAPVGRELRLSRDELQETIHPLVTRTVDELDRTIRAAGCAPGDLAGIFLAGGSSRIPLVSTLIHQHFGRAPIVLDSPKAVIARGAAVSDGLGRRLSDEEVAHGLSLLGQAPAPSLEKGRPVGAEVPPLVVPPPGPRPQQAPPGPGPVHGPGSGQGPGPGQGPGQGPGPGPGPGQGPVPGQGGGTGAADRRRRNRWIIAGVAAGVLVIGGAAAAGVLLSGSTPIPTPTPTPTQPPVAASLDQFVKGLPAGLLTDCQPTSGPQQAAEEIFCQTETGDASVRQLQMSVWVDRFDSADKMNSYVDSLVSANAVPPNKECNAGGPATGTWTAPSGDQQRYVCWSESDGIARLEWTSGTAPFGVQVWRHDADIGALEGWYRQVGYRITGGTGALPDPRGTLSAGEVTLLANLPSDLRDLVRSADCVPWPAGENVPYSPSALVCPGKLAPGATASPSPTPSPTGTPKPAESVTRVVPERVYVRQYTNSSNLSVETAGLYKVVLPAKACENTANGLGNSGWHYTETPNTNVGRLECFLVTSQPRIVWTYTDKAVAARGEAEVGALPGLVHWWIAD